MTLVNPNSLAETLDTIDEALFFGKAMDRSECAEAADWIAARCGSSGGYAGMPSPTRRDFTRGIRLFTGEWVRSAAGIAHILGEEACRTLLRLGYRDELVDEALGAAWRGMGNLVKAHEPTYCCCLCSAAIWRHAAAGGLDEPARRLRAAMRHLADRRDGQGGWKAFPFWYTLLAVSEVQSTGAENEMEYAAAAIAPVFRGRSGVGKYAGRRHALARRILSRQEGAWRGRS